MPDAGNALEPNEQAYSRLPVDFGVTASSALHSMQITNTLSFGPMRRTSLKAVGFLTLQDQDGNVLFWEPLTHQAADDVLTLDAGSVSLFLDGAVSRFVAASLFAWLKGEATSLTSPPSLHLSLEPGRQDGFTQPCKLSTPEHRDGWQILQLAEAVSFHLPDECEGQTFDQLHITDEHHRELYVGLLSEPMTVENQSLTITPDMIRIVIH